MPDSDDKSLKIHGIMVKQMVVKSPYQKGSLVWPESLHCAHAGQNCVCSCSCYLVCSFVLFAGLAVYCS